ncbi:MAG TPA: DUF2953 domain-containing protein [Oscillospiraceae bacterium]|nr:DUF2953 domain-containing protein [Oscillospiraceae bacterium]
MTAWIIILCILLFFAVLLICPVTVKASFENELSAKARYLFISYTIAPQKEKEPKKEKKVEEQQAEEKEDNKSKIKNIIKQKGLGGFLSFVKELSNIAAGAAKKLLKHLIISNLSTDIIVATEDAAQTALNYSYVCAVIYPAFSFLVANCKCKKYSIRIVPDFDKRESKITFSAKASIKLFFIISAALSALFDILKVMKRAKAPEENENIRKNKAVHFNE